MGSAATRLDNIPVIQKNSGNTLILAATNQGQPTRITVGGQSYTPATTLTLAVNANGVNGLDVGSSAGNSNTWQVYAIVNQSSLALALIASQAGVGVGPSMPAGYGTAYKLIGGFNSTDDGLFQIATAYGLYPNLPGVNSRGGGFDPVLGWVFGGPSIASAQNAISIDSVQMTGGQNFINGIGAYSPSIIGQYSAGRTLITNNVASNSLAGESYVKKAVGFGSTMIALNMADTPNVAAFEVRYAPQAVSGTQTSVAGMWSTALMSISPDGMLTLGPGSGNGGPLASSGYQLHRIYGGFTGGSIGTNQWHIGMNEYVAGIPAGGRYEATRVGSALRFLSPLGNGTALQFEVNNSNDTLTTGGQIVANCSNLGAWFFGPNTNTTNANVRHDFKGRIATSGSVDDSGGEGLYTLTTGGVASPPTTIFQSTLGAISGSTHGVAVQLFMTIVQMTSGNSVTYVANATMFANGGTSGVGIGTITALAGNVGSVSAPTLSWSGTSADITRSLQIVVGALQNITVKMIIARRGAGSAYSVT